MLVNICNNLYHYLIVYILSYKCRMLRIKKKQNNNMIQAKETKIASDFFTETKNTQKLRPYKHIHTKNLLKQ